MSPSKILVYLRCPSVDELPLFCSYLWYVELCVVMMKPLSLCLPTVCCAHGRARRLMHTLQAPVWGHRNRLTFLSQWKSCDVGARALPGPRAPRTLDDDTPSSILNDLAQRARERERERESRGWGGGLRGGGVGGRGVGGASWKAYLLFVLCSPNSRSPTFDNLLKTRNPDCLACSFFVCFLSCLFKPLPYYGTTIYINMPCMSSWKVWGSRQRLEPLPPSPQTQTKTAPQPKPKHSTHARTLSLSLSHTHTHTHTH